MYTYIQQKSLRRRPLFSSLCRFWYYGLLSIRCDCEHLHKFKIQINHAGFTGTSNLKFRNSQQNQNQTKATFIDANNDNTL